MNFSAEARIITNDSGKLIMETTTTKTTAPEENPREIDIHRESRSFNSIIDIAKHVGRQRFWNNFRYWSGVGGIGLGLVFEFASCTDENGTGSLAKFIIGFGVLGASYLCYSEDDERSTIVTAQEKAVGDRFNPTAKTRRRPPLRIKLR